jgi:dipeptidyl aminopeptidase/acylaminoacyl peptidase
LANTVQPDYHYHLKTASHPAISPNDKAVAFTVHRFESDSHKAITDIFVKSLGSSSILTQITASGTAMKPAWSVDSKKIAYLDDDDSGVKQVFVRVAAGGDPKMITDHIANVDAISWSPDGSKIAFRALVPGPDELAVLKANPELPNIRTARRIRYQQDGVGWRGDSFHHLFVYDFDTKITSQITDSSTGAGDDGPPVWSPDGSKIAFISDRHPDRETSSNTELYVCNADGSSLEQWSGDMFMVESIAWSPDSRRIAVTGGRTKSEVGGYGLTTQSSIFVLERGSEPIKLTDDSIRPHANGAGFPITADSPFMSWSDSGDGIVFGADSKGQSHIAIANLDEPGDVRLVTDRWQITEMVVSTGAGFAVAAVSSPTTHGELVLIDLNSGDVHTVTNLNSGFFDDHNIATLEKFSLARDGFDIESRVWFPADFDPTKKYPLLLDVHGGPHSAFYDSFYPIHQVAAGAGYVVVAPNPRGSSTYGLNFATAVHCDWGIGDYEDVMAAMEQVASREYIDDSRVVIHGSSYGGFMSSWAVGHTDRFNAAVIAAPVTNLESFYGTSDIGVNFSETQLGGEKFEEIDEYRFHSPLTYARNVNTPVLLLHGEDDVRVPIEQAEQYFVALKRHGKEVEFVRLPGTSHGIFRAKHPMIRSEYFKRMLAWFERHNS